MMRAGLHGALARVALHARRRHTLAGRILHCAAVLRAALRDEGAAIQRRCKPRHVLSITHVDVGP